MFEEEFKNLKPYEKYIVIMSHFKDVYSFASYAYEQGYFKIEFENTKHTQYHLDNIATYRNKLKNQLEFMKMLKSEIDINSLDAYHKKELNSHNIFFDKVEILLYDMDKFLNKHNNNLSC